MEKIENCYNCEQFWEHRMGILCKRDGSVRDTEGALLGCKFHSRASEYKKGPTCGMCDKVSLQGNKWVCNLDLGAVPSEIDPDRHFCVQYTPKIWDKAKEPLRLKQVCISCRHLVSRSCKWMCNLRDKLEEVDPDRHFCSHWTQADEEVESSSLEKFKKELRAVLDDDFDFLVEKNRQYGDSALDPLRIFSQSSTKEQILVRMDDKLSRIKRGDAKIEDTFRDLRNYMNLLEVLERREKAEGEEQ